MDKSRHNGQTFDIRRERLVPSVHSVRMFINPNRPESVEPRVTSGILSSMSTFIKLWKVEGTCTMEAIMGGLFPIERTHYPWEPNNFPY